MLKLAGEFRQVGVKALQPPCVAEGGGVFPRSSCRDRILQNADAAFEIGTSDVAYLDRLTETDSVRYGPKTKWRRVHPWR